MKKILVFGIGIVSDDYLNAFPDIEPNVIGFLVTSNKYCKRFRNKPVYGLSQLKLLAYDEVHVANSHFDTVNQVLHEGIAKEKIVLCYIGLVKEYKEHYGILDVRFNLPAVLTSKLFHSSIPETECFSFMSNQIFINKDYCRLGMLYLLMQEVKNRKVAGELAELGVYKGDFSKYLNREFSDKKLYLFDTFDGFPQDHLFENVTKGYSSAEDIVNSSFSDTSVKTVMDKMLYPEQVVICKGVFPNTIPKNSGDIRYAIVSLDCDLYSPILEGLRYFYPRLSSGGYIMIHDYNNIKFSRGIKKL